MAVKLGLNRMRRFAFEVAVAAFIVLTAVVIIDAAILIPQLGAAG